MCDHPSEAAGKVSVSPAAAQGWQPTNTVSAAEAAYREYVAETMNTGGVPSPPTYWLASISHAAEQGNGGARRIIGQIFGNPLAAAPPSPQGQEKGPLPAGRNMSEAALRVALMDDAEVQLFAKHDPDIFRDVAGATIPDDTKR